MGGELEAAKSFKLTHTTHNPSEYNSSVFVSYYGLKDSVDPFNIIMLYNLLNFLS